MKSCALYSIPSSRHVSIDIEVLQHDNECFRLTNRSDRSLQPVLNFWNYSLHFSSAAIIYSTSVHSTLDRINWWSDNAVKFIMVLHESITRVFTKFEYLAFSQVELSSWKICRRWYSLCIFTTMISIQPLFFQSLGSLNTCKIKVWDHPSPDLYLKYIQD